jgi:ribA/ribD-fused uncharacterized protein
MNEIICFHNPNEENGYLSNWYPSRFMVRGIVFSSMEQYMMYRKAMCFNDEEIATRILEIDDVGEIKRLGRLVANYSEHIWSGMRQIEVYEGLVAKFEQNPDLCAQLSETGNAMLAECAVKDRIWGIGLSMKDPALWRGQNLLGYALMLARKKICRA